MKTFTFSIIIFISLLLVSFNPNESSSKSFDTSVLGDYNVKEDMRVSYLLRDMKAQTKKMRLDSYRLKKYLQEKENDFVE